MKKTNNKDTPPQTALKQATVDQLKVAVYDRLAAIQQLQREVGELNEEIGRRKGTVPTPPPGKGPKEQ